MEKREDFHHDELLDRAVDAVLRDPVPGPVPPDQVAQLVATVRHAVQELHPITLIERIKNMKLHTRIAVAAAIVLALLGLTSLLVPGGGTALAFADVAEALKSVHSAKWNMAMTGVKGPHGTTYTASAIGMFLAPSHERLETIGDHGRVVHVLITDSEKGTMLNLDPANKTATISSLAILPPNDASGRIFQNLRKLVVDAQAGGHGNVERLGAQAVDGRLAEAFRIQLGGAHVEIWADPKTLLPVRAISGCGDKHGVMTDFQINTNVNESLFGTDVPAGYTARTVQISPSRTFWVALTAALEMAAENNNGEFPETLRGEQGIDGTMWRAVKGFENKYGKNSPELLAFQTDVTLKLDRAFGVLNALPPDAWHYAGKGVKLGTPNRPILWAKERNGNGCQVVCADLSVKVVSLQDVPNVPQSEGTPQP